MFSRSDEALYRELVEGDLRAFDTLYARYEQPLFGFLRRQLGDATEAEDVLHETFLTVLRERREGRTARSFRAWVYQVARHLCLNRARHRTRAAAADDQVALLEPAELTAHPEVVLEKRQTAEALARAVKALPSAMSELYHLRAGGLSYEEVAEVLGVPLGTVKSRMHELVRRLRDEVAS